MKYQRNILILKLTQTEKQFLINLLKKELDIIEEDLSETGKYKSLQQILSQIKKLEEIKNYKKERKDRQK